MRIALPVFVLVFAVSCSPPPPEETPDAGEPLVERDAGQMVPPDAGSEVIDAGIPDAGSVIDAGIPDAGPLDSGVVDAGVDAGVVDAGVPDAGCVCALPSFCNGAGTCSVDTNPPQLTVIAGAGGASGVIRVHGTAVDLETAITSVSIRVNAQSAISTPVISGVFDAQITATGTEFTVAITGSDLAGNSASAQTVFDPAAPTIVASPGDAACTAGTCSGAFINLSTAAFTVNATVTDLSLAAQSPVRIRVVTAGGTELAAATDMTRQPNGSWSWTWVNFPSLDETAIDFEITALDASGNVGRSTIHGLIDRVAPVVVMSPSQNASCGATSCTGAVINAAMTSFLVTGSSSGSQVSLRVTDGAATVVPSTALPLDPVGAFSWTWSSIPAADGRYFSVEVTSGDRLGNLATRSLLVLVDRVNPSLVVNSPAANSLIGTAQVSINSTAGDGFGVRAVEVGTSPTGPFTAAMTDANGDYLATLAVPTVDAVEQILTIRATDLVGNTRSTTRRYVADRIAPVVAINGADANCAGASCTGLVANRASTSVAFSGTATDGSPVTIQKTIFRGTALATSTDPLVGTTWGYTWSSLPANVNGAPYELRIVATDAAGNANSQLVRTAWLDNVAPTASIPVGGQRNVNRLGSLLTFSEPMVASSVVSNLTFTPAVSTANFGTTDLQTFSFQSATLANYTGYTLAVNGGTDKAGNALAAPVSAQFLTEGVVRGATTVVRAPTPTETFRAPQMAIDSDGQITAAYTVALSSGLNEYATSFLSGSGVTHVARNVDFTVMRADELRPVSETRGADQRLSTKYETAMVATTSGSSIVWVADTNSSWTTGAPTAAMTITFGVGITRAMPLSDIDKLRPTVELRPYRNETRRAVVAPNNGATAMVSSEQPNPSVNTWTTMTPASLTNFTKFDGRASLEATATLGQYRVRYYDQDLMSEVTTAGFIRGVTGQPATKVLDSFFGVPRATSGAFVAYASDTQLTVACSPSPFATTPLWRPVSVAMPATTTGTGLTSAAGAGKVVFAGEFGGNVHVYSTPLNTCAATPVVTLVGVLNGMREPGVFIEASGQVWVVAVGSAGIVAHKL